jgi:hypothetical protein
VTRLLLASVNAAVLLPEVTSTRPGAWKADSAYSDGLIRPSRWPATWSASATMPANSGDASLVPQTRCQPGLLPGKLV